MIYENYYGPECATCDNDSQVGCTAHGNCWKGSFYREKPKPEPIKVPDVTLKPAQIPLTVGEAILKAFAEDISKFANHMLEQDDEFGGYWCDIAGGKIYKVNFSEAMEIEIKYLNSPAKGVL